MLIKTVLRYINLHKIFGIEKKGIVEEREWQFDFYLELKFWFELENQIGVMRMSDLWVLIILKTALENDNNVLESNSTL